jgi:CBS domain-containing protein
VSGDVRAAPVLDAPGEIIGMIDQQDVVRALTAVGTSVESST